MQISVTIILEKLYFLYLISSPVDVVFLLPIHKKKKKNQRENIL